MDSPRIGGTGRESPWSWVGRIRGRKWGDGSVFSIVWTLLPLPTPSGFQPRIGVQGRLFAGMTKSVAGVYPGSESGTCFRANRLCRLLPAHQCMKSWSCGLVRRIGAVGSATPHPGPSGGQAPCLAKSSTALHSPLPTPLDSGLRRNDDPEDFWDSEALSKPRNIIFVPIAYAGWHRHTKV